MSKPFMKRLSNLLFGGPVPTTPPAAPSKPLPEILFVPVIYANGRDDDSEGLKAFLEHRPVIFDGRLIGPEHNEARLDVKALRLRYSHVVFFKGSVVIYVLGYPLCRTLEIHSPESSKRFFRCEDMTLNAPVQP